MFERISTGWHLAKQSLQVLKLDKELLLFPVFSSIGCVMVMATFVVPVFFSGMLEIPDEGLGTLQKILFGAVAFAYYFVTYFVIVFFNSALVACAIIRLKGGDPTVADGISAAKARLPQIVGWALVSATVGLILKAIESGSERVGVIVANLIGMAWSVTTFFVIPVLVVEQKGPIEAVKKSVSIMKKAWGESLAANFGVGLITFLASLLAIIPIAGGVILMSSVPVLGGVLVVIGVLWILLVTLMSSALGSILVAALYIYAAEGKMPEHFDSALIQRAFATRSRKS